MGGSLNPNEIDVVVILGTISITTTGPNAVDLPLGDLEITATVDVGPEGPAVYSTRYRGDKPIPRFASDATAPITVIDVTSDQTILLAPYAVRNFALGWDTGIAVANTNVKTEQSGTVTFQFFSEGEMEMVTPDDVVMAGSVYTALVSELLAGSEVFDSENFEGYVMVTTDFTDATGTAFISDWNNISITAPLDLYPE